MPLPSTIAIHASTDDSTIGDDLVAVTADPFVDDAFSNPNWKMHTLGQEYLYGGTIIGLVDVIACVCVSEMTEDELTHAIDDAYPWLLGPKNPEARRSDWPMAPTAWCLITHVDFERESYVEGSSITGRSRVTNCHS